MLKRAGVSMVVGSVGAVRGYCGAFPVTSPLGQILFFVAAGFCGLSLIFSLFEPAPEREPTPRFDAIHAGKKPLIERLSSLIVERIGDADQDRASLNSGSG